MLCLCSYKRFIRSKDTSQYSQKDMACIFGNLPSQSAPATPLNQSDVSYVELIYSVRVSVKVETS